LEVSGSTPNDLAFNTTLDRILDRLSADAQVLHALHRATLLAPRVRVGAQVGGGKNLIALISWSKVSPRPRLRRETL
jgi:hypothetical protein